MRFVASPSRGKRGFVYLPRTCFEIATVMHIDSVGTVSERKTKVGDMPILGRCPSMGPDSALPAKIAKRIIFGTYVELYMYTAYYRIELKPRGW